MTTVGIQMVIKGKIKCMSGHLILQVIDGKDLRPIMLSADGTGAIHDCLIQYHAGAAGPGAVRCGAYKGMFTGPDDTVVDGDGNVVGDVRPATAAVSQLFDLDSDIGEVRGCGADAILVPPWLV